MKIGQFARKSVAILLALLLTVPVFPATFSSAAEIEEDGIVYKEIRTIEDLYCIRYDMTSNYKLMNDLDLTEATAEGGDWDFGGRGWDPIGSEGIYSNTPFEGIFDGCGHTIKGMRINVTNVPAGTGNTLYIGLFAKVSGTIRNLAVENMDIVSTANKRELFVGTIGYLTGTAEEIISSGSVYVTSSGSSSSSSVYLYVGGIAGSNAGTIQFCSNESTVKGIAKYSYSNCGYVLVGGIAGTGSRGTITFSYNIGDIIAENGASCRHDFSAAGICGVSGNISNCYNAGNITGSSSGIGGSAIITNCYNVGTTNGSAIGSDGTNNYYLSGTGSDNSGATSRTEAQMKLKSLYGGFDFENVWFIDASTGYPYPQLRENPQCDLAALEWQSLPSKTAYQIGESELITSGGILYAEYLNGDTEEIALTPDMITGFDTSSEGTKTLTVSYKGKTVTYDIQVGEHTFIASEVTAPTCHSEGYTTFTCSGCGATYQDNFTPIIPHNFTVYSVVEPTCSAGGYTVYKCATCSLTHEGNRTEKTEHEYSPTVIAPTCAANGYTQFTCIHCGDTYLDNFVNKIGHVYSILRIVAPTCTEKGYTVFKCNTCDETYIADYTDLSDHTYSSHVVPATCTSAGYTEYTCDVCGDYFRADETPVAPHDYVQLGIIAPTCTSGGYTVYQCQNCSASYDDNFTDPIEHDYSFTPFNPTCTTPGGVMNVCVICGYTYTEENVAPNGHNFGEWRYVSGKGTSEVIRSCSECGTSETKTSSAVLTLSPITLTLGESSVSALTVSGDIAFSYICVTIVTPQGITVSSFELSTGFGDAAYGANLVWSADENYSSSDFALLCFTADSTVTSGEKTVTVIVREAYDIDGNAVPIEGASVTFTVGVIVRGDANGDGVVTSFDLLAVRRYIADFDYELGLSASEISGASDANADGLINAKDVLMLTMYLANYDFELGESSFPLGPRG